MRVQVKHNNLVKRKCQAHFQELATREKHTQNKWREGAELRTIADTAVSSKRHSQREAVKLKQTPKTTELNQADAPT